MRNIKRKWLRIFIAKYIIYLEALAYVFVVMVGIGIFLAFWLKVNDTVQSLKGPLVLKEEDVKATSDCVVLRILVEDKADVRKGDALAEVCEDPAWLNRRQATAALAESLRSLEAMITSGTATARDLALRDEMASLLKAREETTTPSAEVIRAPVDGLFARGALVEGAFVAKGQKLFGVKDSNVLQADLYTLNARYCRNGLKARVKIDPNQTFETLVRLNVKPGWYFSYQDQMTQVTGNDVRAYLEKNLIKRPFEPDNDIALTAKTIQGIDLMVEAKPILGKAGRPETKPERFRARDYDAVVLNGKHTGTIKVTELDPEEQERVREMATESLKKYSYAGDFGDYHVDDMEDMVITVNMAGEFSEPPVDLKANPAGLFPDEMPPTSDTAVSDFVFFSLRKFTFTARLVNPDEELKQEVKELAKQDKSLQVTAEIIVQRKRFAMLLFRSD